MSENAEHNFHSALFFSFDQSSLNRLFKSFVYFFIKQQSVKHKYIQSRIIWNIQKPGAMSQLKNII